MLYYILHMNKIGVFILIGLLVATLVALDCQKDHTAHIQKLLFKDVGCDDAKN